jgi:NodT family efflux transporter outer membrane factor (OMF) lipoprotein
VEAKAAATEMRAAELDAAYLSLAGGIVAEALQAAAAREERGVLEAVIADDERNVALVQKAVDIGSGTRTQLLTAQSQLAADRTLLPALRQQEAVARHALAILVGKAPAEWMPPELALADFTLPGEIPASLPSELARRRPDIRAAEAALHAASAGIGVATANLYPNIDLVGTLTQQALTPGALFEGGATAWSIAANITQPLFDGGRRNAEKRAAMARYHEALANYRQAILTAFQDVADRLQALANDADQLQAQDEATRTASAALDLARRSYQAGNSGILDVLDAQRLYAQARSGLARARAQRLIDTVALYLALGGATYGEGVQGA